MTPRHPSGPVWIFGYGSLVWRPAFAHRERRPAVLHGFARRFWQGSTDHRGVPGDPGRVVTLVEEPGAACWGMAYAVESHDADAVLRLLDHREQGGYDRHERSLHETEGDAPFATALVYVATPSNANWLGPAPLREIARQVRRSRGPSGSNREYVLRLAASLREHGAEDQHVFALAALLERADGGVAK